MEVLVQIFQIHTRRMSLSDDVVAEDHLQTCDGLSGADVGAMCTEAGLIALRDRRRMVCSKDFAQSKINVVYRKKDLTPKGMYL
jgi:26S proteasome regulatory subunit T2